MLSEFPAQIQHIERHIHNQGTSFARVGQDVVVSAKPCSIVLVMFQLVRLKRTTRPLGVHYMPYINMLQQYNAHF